MQLVQRKKNMGGGAALSKSNGKRNNMRRMIVQLAPQVAVQSQPRANAMHTYRHRHVVTPVSDGLKVKPRISTDQWKSMDASRAQLRSHLASQQCFQDSACVPNASQDSSHTLKAGLLSASLFDKIKASKTNGLRLVSPLGNACA